MQNMKSHGAKLTKVEEDDLQRHTIYVHCPSIKCLLPCKKSLKPSVCDSSSSAVAAGASQRRMYNMSFANIMSIHSRLVPHEL